MRTQEIQSCRVRRRFVQAKNKWVRMPNFTERFIQAFHPSEGQKDRLVFDTECMGLGLRATATGRRSSSSSGPIRPSLRTHGAAAAADSPTLGGSGEHALVRAVSRPRDLGSAEGAVEERPGACRSPLTGGTRRAGQHPAGEGSDLVFTVTGKTPPSGFTRAKEALVREMLIEAGDERAIRTPARSKDQPLPKDPVTWRFHDFRRTWSLGWRATASPLTWWTGSSTTSPEPSRAWLPSTSATSFWPSGRLP